MKRFFVPFLAVLIVLSVAAAAPAATKTDHKRLSSTPGLYGGTFVSALAGEPQTFNPLAARDPVSQELIKGVFDGLLEVNPKTMALEPALAEKWTVSRDGLTWTFTLRKGISWSDGSPVTVEDVIFSMNAFASGGLPNPLKDAASVDGLTVKAERVDSRTVRLVLNHPSATLAHQLPPVLPSRILGQPFTDGRIDEIWKAGGDLSTLVGTGPFIPTGFEPGSHVLFQRNQCHWRADRAGKPLPYADRWIVRLVPGHSDVLARFQSGDTDWVPVPAAAWDTVRKGETSGRYKCVDVGPGPGGVFLTLNQNPDSPVFTEKPHLLQWFRDIRFRQAIAYAVDQRAIINEVYHGQGTERWSPVSPLFSDILNSRVAKNIHSEYKAGSLLKEAGFRVGRDKMLRDSRDRLVEFTLLTGVDDPDMLGVAQSIAKQLAKVGIRVNVTPTSRDAMFGALNATFAWQAAIIRVPGHPEPAAIRDVWRSSGAMHFWQPGQIVPVSSWEAAMDDVLAKAERTSDRRTRVKLYADWQTLVVQQLPVIPLPSPNTLYAIRNRVKGAEMPRFGGVEQVIGGFWIGYTP